VKGLEPAFEFLEQASNRELPAGKHPIDGDRFFAIVVRADSRSPETAEFEAHRKYIDIQYLVSGRETIGRWSRIDLPSSFRTMLTCPIATWVGQTNCIRS
jgi:YhcH/YjgK/YiaL family protein